MALDRRLKEAVDLLRRATELGKLRWEKTPDPMEFRGQFQGGSVRVRVESTFSGLWSGEMVTIVPGGSGAGPGSVSPGESAARRSGIQSFHPVSLILLEPNGQTIEEWRPTNSEDVGIVEDLFQLARRYALNIDAKFNSYLDSLRALTEMQTK